MKTDWKSGVIKMTQKIIKNNDLLGQVIEKHGIPQKMKEYAFYHVVLIPDWDPEIYYMETRKFKSYDNAVRYMKKHLLTKEERKDAYYDGSGCKGEAYKYKTVYFDENGDEVTWEQIEKYEDEHDTDLSNLIDEGKINYHDYYIEIVDSEDEEESD